MTSAGRTKEVDIEVVFPQGSALNTLLFVIIRIIDFITRGVYFGVRKSVGMVFNYSISFCGLGSRVKVDVLGSVNSNHNHNHKLINNPNPNPTLTLTQTLNIS